MHLALLILIAIITKINQINPTKLQAVILLFERGALALKLRVALRIKNVFIELYHFLPG
jgi:hypothetical protein